MSWPPVCVWVYVAIFSEGSPQNPIRAFDIKLAQVIQFSPGSLHLTLSSSQLRSQFWFLKFASQRSSITVLIPRGANYKLCHPLISTLSRIAQAEWKWYLWPFSFQTLECFEFLWWYFINPFQLWNFLLPIVVCWFSVNKPPLSCLLPSPPPYALVSDRCNW